MNNFASGYVKVVTGSFESSKIAAPQIVETRQCAHRFQQIPTLQVDDWRASTVHHFRQSVSSLNFESKKSSAEFSGESDDAADRGVFAGQHTVFAAEYSHQADCNKEQRIEHWYDRAGTTLQKPLHSLHSEKDLVDA